MPIVSHRAEDFDPQIASDRPSPGSYWVLLLLVILACAGYILWRRGLRPDPRSFGLAEYSNRPAAVRLSVDDDGVSDLCLSTYSFTADPRAQLTTLPASTSFIMNNDSNESLPSHALSDLPIMPEDHSTLASPQPPYALPDAHLQASSVALLPWQVSTEFPSTGLSRTGSPSSSADRKEVAHTGSRGKSIGGRRSTRSQGPIGGTEESYSDDGTTDIFETGDDGAEDEEDSPSSTRG